MPADILAAITAAGAVYDRGDFADPHLPGPTALTVTADGRVYGHLAQWNVPHIGMGSKVTPPKSHSGYKYFHQGVIATKDGDLPVGKLTLGTGHAPVDGQTDAVAAAAHYDNTGTVAAAVRAGEDDHGIWLAGRIVPGTPPERIDELRLSGVSGDWRGIDGNYELVAALAVNVPGFPLPRTEQLVAGGQPTALVAAGVVVHATDTTPAVTGEDLQAMVAAAAEKLVDDRMAAIARREKVRARVEPVIASAVADRRAATIARVRTALTAAGGRRVRTQEGADMYGVSIGDLIPKAIERAQGMAGEFAEAAGNDVANLIDPGRKKKGSAAPDGAASDSSGEPDNPEVKPGEVEVPEKDTAPEAKPAADAPAPATADTEPVMEPDTLADTVDTSDTDPVVDTDVAPRIDAGAGTDHRMEEDEAPWVGLDGGSLVDFRNGRAYYSDGSWTDGETWHQAPVSTIPGLEPEPPTGEGKTPDAASLGDDFTVEDGLDPYVDDFDDGTPAPGTEVTDTTVPVRTDGDGYLEEDQLPETGAHGGALVDYIAGVGFYDDGTDTDGTTWRYSEPYEDPDAIAASAVKHARMMRRLGYVVPNPRPAPKG